MATNPHHAMNSKSSNERQALIAAFIEVLNQGETLLGEIDNESRLS